MTAAAEHLHLTKAAISISLQELEKQLGQVLFDRIKNRLIINSQGEQLRPLADEVLQRVEGIGQLFEGNQLSGSLRVGASVTVGNHLLPHVLANYLKLTGCRRPTVQIANTAQLCQKLNDFELDIALIEGQVVDEDLVVVPWKEDKMYIVSGPGHPLAHQDVVMLSELNQQEWVLREPKSGTREQFDKRLAPSLEHWRLGMELNSNESIISAVAEGLGLGFISDLSAREALGNGRLVHLITDKEWRRQLYLVYPRKKYVSPILSHFIAYLQCD